MKKYISLMAFCLLAIFSQVLVSCSDDGADEKSNANGYKVDLPSGTSGVKIEPLSDEEVTKLKAQGYNIVGTPVNVTQDGKDHVELKEMATVSFKIPEDFPKEQYNELVAVLITDEGPEYIIPDLEALNEGFVTFKTIHFCETFTVKNITKLNDKFASYVAIHGWDNDLRESDFNKLSDRLKEMADKAGLGENDLLGITIREVLGGNDYVNMTMEYINHYDKGNLTDKAVGDISETLANDLKAKTLAILFTKLKKDPNNKTVKECLEKCLTQENAEKAGTLLGSENPTDVALEFAKDFAIDKMKDFATQNPYVKAFVKAVEIEAKAIDIFHKFWARNDMMYYYNEFAKLQNQSDNPESNWNQLAWRIGTPKFEFNMTLEEMKEMFKKRYYDEKKINAKKAEILELIDLWNIEGLLSDTDRGITDTDIGHARTIKEFFTKTIDGKLQDDYCMRLTRLHKLMERFRKELVVDGYLKDSKNAKTINKYLCEIVYQYIIFYPDEKAFYKWLAKEGYIKRKLEKNVDNLGEKRSWWLIETIIKKHENTTRDNGHYVDYMNYTATETEQTMTGMCTGMKSYYEYVQQPVSFVSTIQAPPAKIESGEKIVLHCTVKRTSPDAYCHIEMSPWMTWESEYSQTFASKTNVVGATGVGTRDIHATSGEWDFELSISSGSKNQKNKLILGAACESQIHWVYRWCSIFEKDEQ